MKGDKKEKKAKYITFNLYEREYEHLKRIAEENGSTISQTVRWLLFIKKAGIISENTLKNLDPCTETTCREYLKTYRKECENLSRITAKIESHKTEDNDNYLQLLIEEATQYIKHSLEILATTFDKLNVSKELQTECKNIPLPATKNILKVEPKDAKTNLKYYFYMQKITICGAIAAEPETFTSKNNSELTRFTVTCDERGDKTNYDVYASAYIVSEILPLLTIKRQVIVTGDFRIRSSTSKSGAAQNPLSVRADSITLGMEVLQ